MLTVGSLCSGIGGLDLGLERAGMEVRWQSEIDPYCCKVLEKHWPHVPNLGDVKAIDWKAVEPVDLICGGYPCQPFSLAGVRRGESDPRHLWPWFRDALRELRPRYALLENVPGHLGLGFGTVLGDLAGLGYDTEWDCIPAAAVGAPHLRYRVFVVAHTGEFRRVGGTDVAGTGWNQAVGRETGDHAGDRGSADVADADSARRRQEPGSASGDEGADAGRAAPDHHVVDGDGQSRRTGHVADTDEIGRGGRSRLIGQGRRRQPADGGSELSDTYGVRLERTESERIGDGEFSEHCDPCGSRDAWWAVEPDVGRVAHGVPHRVDRLRGLGNAVVPQVAEWVGQRILEAAL